MVKLRLRRRGRKRLRVYDIVAADSRSPRDGRYIERLGQYNPLVTSGATMLDRERVAYWLKRGAQPTDTVRNILSREGVLLAMQMEAKGAPADEIASAVDAHVMHHRSREATRANNKKASAEAAGETEEEVADAPAEQGESATSEATPETATAEATTVEVDTAPVEEAAPEEETPAEKAPAAEAEEPPAEETTGDESNNEEKSGK